MYTLRRDPEAQDSEAEEAMSCPQQDCGDCACRDRGRPSDVIGTIGSSEYLRSVRAFSTGATRDTDDGKLKYEGFFSPAVLRRRAEYMHKHRVQSDGELREADNWQKGIPIEAYMDSLIRHVMEAWFHYRESGVKEDLVESLCAIGFNSDGAIFELIRSPHDAL